MSDLLNWIHAELQTLVDDGLFRRRREVTPLSGGRYLVDGREVWDFASNDYLGLASDSRVVAAASDVLNSHGVGAKASPLVSGRTDLHAKLERELADFEGAPAAILFPTGMAANVGTVTSLASADDVVFSDRLNHASLIDGSRLSGAKLRIYRHDDLANLDESLARESARRKFIVTDSVFSMDGDLAPLAELCEIGERHSAAVIVDEAHGTGVFGQRGRGVAELLNVENRVAVRVGTLSKAIGTIGGFVTGSQALIDFLWNKARTQIYSTALPPAVCAAAIAAIQIIRSEPSRRERLQAAAKTFRDQLRQAGVSPLTGSVGPIVPIVLNEPQAAIAVAEQLFSDGFLVGAIRPPTVPRGTSRLRVTLHANIPDDVMQSLASCLSKAIAGHV
jgi:8-amino-7-oxononanoate synthase